jgi:hypothetical protein
MTRRTLAAVVALAAAAPAPALAHSEPELVGRAILPADASAPAPFPGVIDTDPAPAPGARQPVGGFSALLDAAGRDTFYAMPDNGFGSKTNSKSFLLRVYRVRVDFETRRGGDGDVEIRDWITLSDPDRNVPFPIVTEGSRDRLLTGGDFDPESMRVARDGTLWFGDEFGPFLLHTDARGRVLEAPIALPDGVRSPDAPPPYALPPTLGRSNGFEGMAISPDGHTLHPALEGPVTGDDPTVRRVYEFDIRKRRWSSTVRQYRVADPTYLLSDFTALDKRRFVSLERDNFQGPAAQHKRAFVYDLRSSAKREVLDQLDIADPELISLPARTGDFGLGDPFKMPYLTIESVLPLGDDRLAIVNDTNFGSTGRNPSLPDYSDFIVVDVPGVPSG